MRATRHLLIVAAAAVVSCVSASPLSAAPKRRPKPAAKPAEAAPAAAPTEAPPAAPTPKRTGRVEVVVVDVAGDLVYVKPGAAMGVRRGTSVTLRNKRYKVVGSTASYAVIVGAADGLKENDKGAAASSEEAEEQRTALAPPQPLVAFQNIWPAPVAPASTQRPRYVPLGEVSRGSGAYRILLSSSGMALLPFDERSTGVARGELRARVHAAPFSAPLTLDLDAAVQGYAAPDLSAREGSRPLVRVRELLLGYGRPSSFRAGLGRMRYAAATLGTLDGLRADVPLGAGFSAGAFGGLLPDPLTGGVAADAQRFGVDARYADTSASLRPEVTLVGHGSTFKGQLDEKRLSAIVGLYPGQSRLGGHAELSSFESSNPWKASPLELTAAGVDASLRLGPVQMGGRFDVRQQERSAYLASFLPLSWFCATTLAPAAAGTPARDVCVDGRGSQRLLEAADATLELGNFGIGVGSTAQQTSGGGPKALGGFANARLVRIARHFRLEAAGNLSSGTYVDLLGASAGPGVSVFADTLDASLYYRFAQLSYRAAPDTTLRQHAAGAMFVLLPASEFVLTLQGEGQTGDDVKAVLALMNVLWRPRL